MTKRLEILTASLEKKSQKFDSMLDNHLATVKQANGQPLNDKRNGHATLRKWDTQNDALRTMQGEIENTKAAIENERYKIAHVQSVEIPEAIMEKVKDGTLSQWRKHPNRFFVNGVDKGRIVWQDGKLLNSYYTAIPTQEQKEVFKAVYLSLQSQIKVIAND